MVKSEIQAHIHFQHAPEEVAALSKAIIPMREHILAVSNSSERQKMKAILELQYFRVRDASDMVAMLLRAAKYAKMHLGEFFPAMRAQVLDDALELEETALYYKAAFDEFKNITIPTH